VRQVLAQDSCEFQAALSHPHVEQREERLLLLKHRRAVSTRAKAGMGHVTRQGGTMGPKVREHMTDRPRCVTPETPVSEAAELMASEDVGSLPILDGDELVGVVTDRDIVVRAVAKKKNPQGMPVREVASSELVTVGPEQDLSEALKLMASHQVRRLPVVDEDNHLVGVLAQADVAAGAKEKAVGEMVEEISHSSGPRM
jgi:CBS domain-containing protein